MGLSGGGPSLIRSGLQPRDCRAGQWQVSYHGISARTTHPHCSREVHASLLHLAPPRTPPLSKAQPLPDVGAAQGEPQQVERSAAHAQANEADHRDELWETEGTVRVSPLPAVLSSPLQAFLPVRPHPCSRADAPSLLGESTWNQPPHSTCRSFPHPKESLSEGDSGGTGAHCKYGLRYSKEQLGELRELGKRRGLGYLGAAGAARELEPVALGTELTAGCLLICR